MDRHTKSAPVKVVSLAHDLGLKVYTSESLGNNVSGLIKKDQRQGGSSGYAIFVNAKQAKVRQRFTIAHEISHFVLHKSFIGDGIVEDALLRADGFTNSLERQANGMAADILMPRALISEAQESGITSISALANYFGVSRDAMSVRVLGYPYIDDTMAEKTDYEAKAANLLKAELKRKGVTYAQLVEKLAAIGIVEAEANIRNKLSRGKFTVAFLLQCLQAVGVHSLMLD